MVNYQSNSADANLDRVFSALADRTRRAILARLAEGEATAGELAEPFEMSLPAVSKHLRVLEGAGFLQRKRDGRFHRCELDPKALETAAKWISTYKQFWQGQLDQLAKYLENGKNGEKIPGKKENGNERDGNSGD